MQDPSVSPKKTLGFMWFNNFLLRSFAYVNRSRHESVYDAFVVGAGGNR